MDARKQIVNKAKKGFKGFPQATIALYGPSNRLATKIALGIFTHKDADPIMMRWHSEIDIRHDTKVMHEILKTLKLNEVKSVVMTDKIIGCPHEEGVDYPEKGDCVNCTYWMGKDRWE